MRTKTVTLYKINELDEDAKEKAIKANRDWNVDDEWWDGVYDWAKEAATKLGLSVSSIYFSGFGHQGQGSCFSGDYTYVPGCVEAIQAEFPQDAELLKIAKDLAILQSEWEKSIALAHIAEMEEEEEEENIPSVEAVDLDAIDFERYFSARIRGIERSYRVEVDLLDPPDDCEIGDDEVASVFESFNNWIFSSLRKEYEYLSSDEAVYESLLSNEYEFNEDGSKA
jgi:hypothetical protein